jgi:DNA primase
MRRLNDEDIAQIRQQANIVDVISSYIPLQQAGSNYKAICPFHDDTNPSLSVNAQKQIFKCFACGVGGNVFTFVKDYEEISFIEAVIKVGQMVGFDLSQFSVDNYKPKIDNQTSRYFRLMDEAQQYIEFTLTNTKDDQVRDFLKDRGLTQSLIKTFQIGYIDPNFPLAKYLNKKGYSYQEIEAVHLATLSDGDYYDVFNSRILFPIKTHDNQVVAYTARSLTDNQTKYINSATSPIYQKANILYNYHNAMERAYKDDSVVVCEGVMDVIAFHKSGHPKSVATLGTALSNQQVQLLKKMNSDIVLGFDGDTAGQQAMLNIGTILRENRLNVFVYNNNSTDDPDDISQKRSKEALKEMVDKPKHWMEFILEYGSKLYSLTSYNAKKQVVEFVLNHLKLFDKIDQTYFISQLSNLTGFDEQTLGTSLSEMPSKAVKRRVEPIKKSVTTNQLLQSEKQILSYLVDGKKYGQMFKLQLGYLIDPNANDLALLILNLYNVHDTISVADCLNLNLNPIQESVLLEISEDSLYQVPKTEKHLKELMIQVQIADIDNMLKINQSHILKAESSTEKIKLMNEKIELHQRKDKLKMEASDEEI